MFDSVYNHLTGTISIPFDAPLSWKDDLSFYENPNNTAWGGKLVRNLYHESVHFWQFIWSGYIAQLVYNDWYRLNNFEKNHVIIPNNCWSHFCNRNNFSFSPYELIECLARFWDVHTRGPHEIIKEENIVQNLNKIYEFNIGQETVYTGEAFDTVMQEGEDCVLYAAPYRWMLDQTKGDSFFVATIFPIIAYFSLLTDEPVKVFCQAFELARKSKLLRSQILATQEHNVILAWLENWDAIRRESLTPIFSEGMSYSYGFGVIKSYSRGYSHPIFDRYLSRFKIMIGQLKFLDAVGIVPQDQFIDFVYRKAIRDGIIDSNKVFALPGIPVFRNALGLGYCPPIIKFKNFTLYHLKSGVDKIWGMLSENVSEDDEKISADLHKRENKFRRAEQAVSLGLPIDVFEN